MGQMPVILFNKKTCNIINYGDETTSLYLRTTDLM